MEILIPGLILVALMVYASTKIKKHAARAFEPEIIETEEFTILKPAGFINPTGGDNGNVFEAYSKEFGEGAAGNRRQASAKISVFPDANFDEICENVKRSATNIISETSDDNSCIIEAEGLVNVLPAGLYYKIAKGNSRIYELQILVLPEHKNEYLHRIKDMLESFGVK